MIPGLRGSLLSHDALEAALRDGPAREPHVEGARRWMTRWQSQLEREAGPAWSARAVFDRIAVPFCRACGLDVVPAAGGSVCGGLLRHNGSNAAAVIATPWGMPSASAWHDAVRAGIAENVRWCYCFTGPSLSIFDARRTHARHFLELDLAQAADHLETFELLWRLVGSGTRGPAAGLDEAAGRSERYRVAVRESLQAGVHEALVHLTAAFASASRGRRRRLGPPAGGALLDESLIVIYRVLFLLFAEARGVVPAWHPVFRESYTLESLRGQIETLPRPRGVWEALQAIARLAHRGCHAGTLRVAPFNGRLFSPAHAPLAESLPLDETAVRNALLALTTRKTEGGRRRIAYADLGVEQLGGVYERVLDFDLAPQDDGAPRLIATGRRKATGTFYTPRTLTEYLVRRTLTPLVRDRRPDEILSLRVLDPSMGSGAFLVAACRFLAAAYEAALVRDGDAAPADLSDADRASFRRTVAQRTLFGVDVNPMAVQLARLSLWLTTLATERPLTFFDHHLRAGNSLVGARIGDVCQRRTGHGISPDVPLPLFDILPLEGAIGAAAASGASLRDGREDTAEQVRAKESLFARIQAGDAPLARWKEIVDLWCAGWFTTAPPAITRSTFQSLLETAAGKGSLPDRTVHHLLDFGREAARRQRFFHWELEFPEIFHDADGLPLPGAGFDAILGNPPWDMLRGSEDAANLTRFARGSGIYRLQGGGHANLYQLFIERALMLLRDGGRLGLVVPSGFATDHGCAALRRHVLESARIDSCVVAENRRGIFPIHRGLKFMVLTLTTGDLRRGAQAQTVPLRTGVESAADFDRLPDAGPDPEAVPVSRELIARLSGEQCVIPEIHTREDASIVSRVVFSLPAAGDEDGWRLKFGRELNATDDREHFNAGRRGLPVVEGKQVQPFAVDLAGSKQGIDRRQAMRLLPGAPFDRPRVAYRDVASSTNRLTLIAAVLPAGTVTTHTLFCLKTPLEEDEQQFVCGMLNSFVANYLVRLRVTTHVTVAIVERLALPKPPRDAPEFQAVVRMAHRLAAAPGDSEAYATLQALAARLYGLTASDFEHILTTFPLVDTGIRRLARQYFR